MAQVPVIKATDIITILNSNLTANTSAALPTPGSFVQISDLGADATSITVSVTGTYTGALTIRGSVDCKADNSAGNWFVLGPAPFVNTANGVVGATIASAATGLFNVNVSGLKGVRINAEATVTGSATVSMWRSVAPGAVSTVAQTSPFLQSVAVPQSGTDTVIKASAGFLGNVVVTSLATAPINIYDNATTHTGTIIAVIPGSTPVGTVIPVNTRVANGITVQGAASQPNITANYA